jgi:hypothetical protein
MRTCGRSTSVSPRTAVSFHLSPFAAACELGSALPALLVVDDCRAIPTRASRPHAIWPQAPQPPTAARSEVPPPDNVTVALPREADGTHAGDLVYTEARPRNPRRNGSNPSSYPRLQSEPQRVPLSPARRLPHATPAGLPKRRRSRSGSRSLAHRPISWRRIERFGSRLPAAGIREPAKHSQAAQSLPWTKTAAAFSDGFDCPSIQPSSQPPSARFG